MAVNYTNLFENIGEYVDRVNEFSTILTTLGTAYAEIAADLETNGQFNILDGEFARFNQYRAQVLGWINEMKGRVQVCLLDKVTVLDELMYGSDIEFNSVIAAIFKDMDGSQSILNSTVTLGSVGLTGAGNGSFIVSKVLDGVNAPSNGYPVVADYNGIDSELALTDEMGVTCITDSESGGVNEGFETFQWAGRPTSGDNYSWETFGTGAGPTLQPIQSSTLIVNTGFETFTSNVPDSWTLNTGTAGTHVFEETGTVFNGTACLKLTGTGALAAINLSQAVTATLVPNKRYMVGFWVLGEAGTSAGTLTVQFEGTDYTADSSEKIELNAAALAALTAWNWKYFWINMPAEIPDDLALVIKWTGTPSAHSVRLDFGGMKEAVYFNGHCGMVVSGDDKFLAADRFTYTVTNDYAGVFQTAFAKMFGVQLPSDASPSIADSLAT